MADTGEGPVRDADRHQNRSGWSRVEELIDAAKCVSFDLFDTLVFRRGIFFPKDMFAVVEQEAVVRLGGVARGFARRREEAELAARAQALRAGRMETRFEDIYAIVGRRMQLSDNDRSLLMEMELDCERAVLEKDEDAAALFDYAVAHGKVVAITTDTYFDETFIRDICYRFGYGKALLFVSSTSGKVKHDGSLFDLVVEHMRLAPKQIVHIGDNVLSDVTAPTAKGLRSWHYLNERASFQKRLGIPTMSSGSAFLSKILCEIGEVLTQTRDAPGQSEGRVALSLGFLLLGFSLWLTRQANALKPARIYFVAREGLLLKRCFDLIARHAGQQHDTRYLLISRTSLYPSLLFADRETALDVFSRSWSKTTVGQAAARLSLPYSDVRDGLLDYGFQHPTDRLHSGTFEHFRRFIVDNWQLIQARNGEKHRRAVDYLTEQDFFEPEDTMLVDIGWHLTLQRCLGALSEARGIERPIHGRYLATFGVSKYDLKGDALGYLVSYGAPHHLSELIRWGPSLLEILHGAGHGTTIGYTRTASGKTEPILEDNADESEQHESLIAPIQEAALRNLEEWAAGLFNDNRNVQIAPELCAAIGLAFVSKPTRKDADLLGGLLHAQDFAGSMKSITGVAEWNLARVLGDVLPDGTVPMWRPGFEVLRTTQLMAAKAPASPLDRHEI